MMLMIPLSATRRVRAIQLGPIRRPRRFCANWSIDRARRVKDGDEAAGMHCWIPRDDLPGAVLTGPPM